MIARMTDAFSTALIAVDAVVDAVSTPFIAVMANVPILPMRLMISPACPPIADPRSFNESPSSPITLATFLSAACTFALAFVVLSFASL